MRRLFLLTVMLLFVCPLVSTSSTPPRLIRCTFRDGSVLEMMHDNGYITSFAYSNYRRVNQSIHDCSIEARRSEDSAEWVDADGANSRTTEISFTDNSAQITIEMTENNYRVQFAITNQGNFCGAGVMLPRGLAVTRRNNRYVGRILR